LTPSARSANLIAGDGTKNRLPAPNKEPATNQNNYLTGKAPYKFESLFLFLRLRIYLTGNFHGCPGRGHFGKVVITHG
jgi:hypothetical protein